MVVLSGANFANKKSMYKDMKSSFIKFLGNLAGDKRTTQDIKLEPAWRNLVSSRNSVVHPVNGTPLRHKEVYAGVYAGDGKKKKRINSKRRDCKVITCDSCVSF